MRARGVVIHAFLGAAAGGLAGLFGAAAFSRFGYAGPGGIILAAAAGLAVSSAGGLARRSRRAFLSEVPAGALAAAGLFALARRFPALIAPSGDMPALAAVAGAAVFSALIAALHTWHTAGRRVVFASAVFAVIGGLLALAAAVPIVNARHAYATFAAAGAVYGAAVWAAVGISRWIFGVDVGEFRV